MYSWLVGGGDDGGEETSLLAVKRHNVIGVRGTIIYWHTYSYHHHVYIDNIPILEPNEGPYLAYPRCLICLRLGYLSARQWIGPGHGSAYFSPYGPGVLRAII